MTRPCCNAGIPGCESITAAEGGANPAYDVAMTAAVGPVKARFKGRMELADVAPPRSYTLHFDGQGGAAGLRQGQRPGAAHARRPHGHAALLHRNGAGGGQACTNRLTPCGRRRAQTGRRVLPALCRRIRPRRDGWRRTDMPRRSTACRPHRRFPIWPRANCRPTVHRQATHPTSAPRSSRAIHGRGSSWRWWPWRPPTCFCTTGHNRSIPPQHITQARESAANASWTASILKS